MRDSSRPYSQGFKLKKRDRGDSIPFFGGYMTRIKELVDRIEEELNDAKTYAEDYLTFKAKGNANWANRYKEMANDELKHAVYIHERAVEEIEELRKVYTPPEEMMEKWESSHRKFLEKNAWIKQMLAM